jgi:hypothetical protein
MPKGFHTFARAVLYQVMTRAQGHNAFMRAGQASRCIVLSAQRNRAPRQLSLELYCRRDPALPLLC